ncbi:MAG: hypothetical protein ABJN05_17440, partial [Sulfitobacter dubius]
PRSLSLKDYLAKFDSLRKRFYPNRGKFPALASEGPKERPICPLALKLLEHIRQMAAKETDLLHKTASQDESRHRKLFEILCHAERAAQTSARLAQSANQPLDKPTAQRLRQEAIRSLHRNHTPNAGRPKLWDSLLKLLQGDQKNAAASNSTVITPMIAPFDGSVIGIDTRL